MTYDGKISLPFPDDSCPAGPELMKKLESLTDGSVTVSLAPESPTFDQEWDPLNLEILWSADGTPVALVYGERRFRLVEE